MIPEVSRSSRCHGQGLSGGRSLCPRRRFADGLYFAFGGKGGGAGRDGGYVGGDAGGEAVGKGGVDSGEGGSCSWTRTLGNNTKSV